MALRITLVRKPTLMARAADGGRSRPNNHAALTSPASLLTCRAKNKNGRGVVTVLCRILPAVFALFVASAAQAQNYPDRPIRLIAPFPAGGLADVLARRRR
jgi:hypothetical protein